MQNRRMPHCPQKTRLCSRNDSGWVLRGEKREFCDAIGLGGGERVGGDDGREGHRHPVLFWAQSPAGPFEFTRGGVVVAVEDCRARVGGISQHTCDRAVPPRLFAGWRRHAILVEVADDATDRRSGCVLIEDPPHHGSLGFVDLDAGWLGGCAWGSPVSVRDLVEDRFT